MSLLASWLASQQQVRSQWLAHDRSRREELYKEFIEEAAKCYVDALLHEKPDIALIVVLYAKMSRMRVLSSQDVIEGAEQLIKQIMDTYSAPAKTLTNITNKIRNRSTLFAISAKGVAQNSTICVQRSFEVAEDQPKDCKRDGAGNFARASRLRRRGDRMEGSASRIRRHSRCTRAERHPNLQLND